MQFRASHAGFIEAPYGRKGPVLDLESEEGVLLTSGSPVDDIKIQLMPESVIAGQVGNEVGEPVTGGRVRLLQSMVREGRRVWEEAFGVAGQATDSRGEYRFAGVRPGNYIICASSQQRGYPVGGGKAFSYGESCYPGLPTSAARVGFQARPGNEARFDFNLSPLPSVHLSGKAAGLPKDAQGNISVTRRNEQLPIAGGAMNRGEFLIVGIPPGAYVITATSQSGGHNFFATLPVDVGAEDLENISLPFQAGVPVKGAVRIESQSAKPTGETQQAGMWLQPVGSSAVHPRGPEWGPDRISFAFPEVSPGHYKIGIRAPSHYYVKSVTLQGRDLYGKEFAVTTEIGPIEIVLAADGGVLDGTIANAEGVPVVGDVLLLGRDSPLITRTDESGNFKMENIPPGEYKAWAFDDLRNVEYADAEWMLRNAGDGTSLTIVHAGSAHISLVQRITSEAPDVR